MHDVCILDCSVVFSFLKMRMLLCCYVAQANLEFIILAVSPFVPNAADTDMAMMPDLLMCFNL